MNIAVLPVPVWAHPECSLVVDVNVWPCDVHPLSPDVSLSRFNSLLQT